MRAPLGKSTFLDDDDSSVSSEDEIEESVGEGDDRVGFVATLRASITNRQQAKKLNPVGEGGASYKKYDFPQPETEKYVILYRGVRYSTDCFSHKSRRKSAHFIDQNGRDVFSSAVFRNANLGLRSIGDYVADEMTLEDKQLLLDAETLSKNFLEFLYKRTDLKPKINSGYVYGSLLLALIQINTNLYTKVDSYVDELRQFLNQNTQKFQINNVEVRVLLNSFRAFNAEELDIQRPGRKVIISTSVRDKVGIQYALPYIEDGLIKGFDPEYDDSGKPKHRHGGEVGIFFVPSSVYIAETSKIGKMSDIDGRKHKYEKVAEDGLPKCTDLHLNRTRRILQPDIRIMEQFEVAFFNKIEGKYFIETFPVYYPNFSKDFDRHYHPSTYVIENAEKFNEPKSKLVLESSYVSGIEDLTKILQNHYEAQLATMVDNILSKGAEQPLSAGTPMINANGEIQTQRYLRQTTIHSRFDHVEEPDHKKLPHDDMEANISVNTSPAKNSKPLTVNAPAKTSGYYLA